MGQTPSTQIKATMPQFKRITYSGRENLNRIQAKGQAMGKPVLNNIQNSDNIRGALQRGQAMGKAALQNIQNSDFFKG